MHVLIFLAALRNCGGLEAQLHVEEYTSCSGRDCGGAVTIMLPQGSFGQCKSFMLAKHNQSSQASGV